MSVVIETTQGDITVDLFLAERPKTCLNFLKLCKLKAYNMNLFHTVQADFIAQTGDPSGTGRGGESIFCQLYGPQARFFEAETAPRIKHTKPGLISMVNCGESMLGSQFFLTLGDELDYLDGEHCVFGEVVEGEDVLSNINNTITDNTGRPYQDIRITHTVVLHDPYDDPSGLELRGSSPEPSEEMLASSRIGADENINDYAGKSEEEINEIIADKEAKARATILEMVGDIPDAEIAPPENVLFVCKLNPVTCDDDLEIIFSRFGPVVTCEVIKDRVSGDSLQYAFVEFGDRAACEQAYFKMDNVLIDDRRIHVDFSQSVSKYRWKGKGRLEVLDDKKHEEKKKVDLKELIDKERAEIVVKTDGKIERNSDNLKGRGREGNYRGRDDRNGQDGGRENRRREDKHSERDNQEDRPREREEKRPREREERPRETDERLSEREERPKEREERPREREERPREREDRQREREEKPREKEDRQREREDRPKETEYRSSERRDRDDWSRGDKGADRPREREIREDGFRNRREDRPREREEKNRRNGNSFRDVRGEGDVSMRSRGAREEYRRDRRDEKRYTVDVKNDRRGEERDDRPRARVDQFGRERLEDKRNRSGSDSSREGERKKNHSRKRRDSSGSD
eukprot:GFUD01031607.1.p1 GENE.GFUD01031607.1~~GFUD01031607.1.p1  ORF type:complete len:634 (-),score=250.58 GFUD01031607.1:189-2090(-)